MVRFKENENKNKQNLIILELKSFCGIIANNNI